MATTIAKAAYSLYSVREVVGLQGDGPLQELIAPDDVMFYGEDWGYLGSKAHDEDVRISLAEITGIDVRVLEGTIQPSEISIADE